MHDVCAKGGKFKVLLGEKGMQNVPNQRKCCTKREVGDLKIQAAQVGVRKKQIFEDGRGHEGPGPSMHRASCPGHTKLSVRLVSEIDVGPTFFTLLQLEMMTDDARSSWYDQLIRSPSHQTFHHILS
jgi:hypothetical protein